MLIELQRGSRYKREVTSSLATFVAYKLMPRMAPKLCVQFQFVTGLFKRDGIFGDCSYYESERDPREFVVRLDAGIEQLDLLKTVAHEMVHVKQISRSELKELIRSPYYRFHKKYYHKSIDYFDKPWEIEAHGREEGLVVQWLRSKN